MSAYSDLVQGLTPMAYWRLGESSGSTTITDSSGNGHTGTTSGITFGVNSTPFDVITSDTAASASGSGYAYMGVGTSSDIAPRVGAIELWVKVTTPSGTATLFGADPFFISFSGGILLNTSGVLSVGFGTGGVTTNNVSITDGNWHHVVLNLLSYNSGTGSTTHDLWVDGSRRIAGATHVTFTGGISLFASVVAGNTTQGNFLTGSLAEVAIYNGTPLTTQQIQDHYYCGIVNFTLNAPSVTKTVSSDDASGIITAGPLGIALSKTSGSTYFSSPLVHEGVVKGNYYDLIQSYGPQGYWRLDESSGTVANDVSGNSHNGTYITGLTLDSLGIFYGNGDACIHSAGSGILTLPADSGINTSNNNAWSFWFKTDPGQDDVGGGAEHCLFERLNGSNRNAIYIRQGGFLEITDSGASGGAFLSPQKFVADCNWHHIFYISNYTGTSTSTVVFLDGIAVISNLPSNVHSTRVTSCFTTFAAGSVSGDGSTVKDPFSGYIDEIAFYYGNFTSLSQIGVYLGIAAQDIYRTATRGASSAGPPLSYYRMNEPSTATKLYNAFGGAILDTASIIGSGLTFSNRGLPGVLTSRSIFSAGSAIVYLGDDSTNLFPGATNGSNFGIIHFWIKTVSVTSSSTISQIGPDLKIQVRNGFLVVVHSGLPGGLTNSGVFVADGNWHNIALAIPPVSHSLSFRQRFDLNIDGVLIFHDANYIGPTGFSHYYVSIFGETTDGTTMVGGSGFVGYITELSIGLAFPRNTIVFATQQFYIQAFYALAQSNPRRADNAYVSTILQDSPSIYYRLGEIQGSNYVFDRGYAYGIVPFFASVIGSPTLGVQGITNAGSDTAVQGNGTDGLISNFYTTFSGGFVGLTTELWARRNGNPSSNEWLVSGGVWAIGVDTSGNIFYQLYDHTAGLGNVRTYTTSKHICDDTWHYIVLISTTGGFSTTLYVDLQTITTSTAPLGFDSGQFISRLLATGTQLTPTAGSFFSGKLDEVAAYPTQLSPARMSAHYKQASATIVATVSGIGNVTLDHLVPMLYPNPLAGSGNLTSSGLVAPYFPNPLSGIGRLTARIAGSIRPNAQDGTGDITAAIQKNIFPFPLSGSGEIHSGLEVPFFLKSLVVQYPLRDTFVDPMLIYRDYSRSTVPSQHSVSKTGGLHYSHITLAGISVVSTQPGRLAKVYFLQGGNITIYDNAVTAFGTILLTGTFNTGDIADLQLPVSHGVAVQLDNLGTAEVLITFD